MQQSSRATRVAVRAAARTSSSETSSPEPARDAPRETLVGAPGLSMTMVMSIAAVAAALIAIFGDKTAFSWVTVAFALAGLVPWALEAGAVRVPPWAFYAMTMVPVAGIVLIDRNPGGMFPAMLAVVWLTRLACGPALTFVPVATALAITVALAGLENTTHETGTVYFAGGAGVAFLAGTMIRRQDQLLAQLHEARAREAFHAASDERTRIAREIHDVVAHSLTVTMLHVTGARRAITHDPARAADALERAETVGRESLDSIRRVVGLLRSDGEQAGDASPLPTLADVPELVRQFREAGLVIDEELELDDVVADATTSLTAYRVVQEALSNVLQHAPGAPVWLRMVRDGAGTVLRIVAENPIPPTSAAAAPPAGSSVGSSVGSSDAVRRTGLGLRGMDERVRAAGGSVETGAVEVGAEAGVVADRRWRVDAALPLRRLAAQP